ncbi:hypothetical protein CEK25_013039 [Fusarium fujikuroi]|nr:hypothetical protein CEK25_013039 [Fusarium fujikuroi]
MASPTPDATAPINENTSRDVTVEKEQKSEVNGHATPEKPKDTPESAPVNGNKADDHLVENGVHKDVEMAEANDEKKPSQVPSADEKNDQKTEGDDQTKDTGDAKPVGEPKAGEDSKATEEDVDMTDAVPAEKSGAENPAGAATAKESKDVDMVDKPADTPEKAEGTDDKAPASSNNTAAPSSETEVQPTSLSQLAIDTKEADAPKPSTEVSMQDAPVGDTSVSSKVAREREDDATDEPAPKRAKTEPKSEEPADVTSTVSKTDPASAESAPEKEISRFAGLTRWNEADFKNQTLTPFQRREFRKVLGRVKKTKAKVAISKDLPKIGLNLREINGYLAKIGDFQKPMVLLSENTRNLTGTLRDINGAALCYVNFKQEPKPMRLLVLRSMPFEASIATIPQEEAVAEVSKDLIYHEAFAIKNWLKEPVSEEVLNIPKNHAINNWFMELDAEGLNIPHYYSIIKKPMDWERWLVCSKSGDINNIKDFDKNVSADLFQLLYYFNGLLKDKDSCVVCSFKAIAPEDYYGSEQFDEDKEAAG